jgi:hypothetical protein
VILGVMSDHVVIRKLEHVTGSSAAPRFGYAIETRESAGPAHKQGSFPDDVVWLKLHGGLVIGKAKIRICWIGEYSSIAEVRGRTRGAPIHDLDSFWSGRPKAGYAAVAELAYERWAEPRWQGPRTYGYEWVVLDNDSKRNSWLEDKPPPRGGADLLAKFEELRRSLS